MTSIEDVLLRLKPGSTVPRAGGTRALPPSRAAARTLRPAQY